MKRLVWLIGHSLGIYSIFRWLHRHRLIILLYHGVEDTKLGHPALWNYRSKYLSTASFKRQIAYLSKHYNIIKLDQAIEQMKASKLPPYSLVITFDDGYRNFFLQAYPILKNKKVPATIFLATDFVFKQSPLWTDRLEYASALINKNNLDQARKSDDLIRNKLKQLPNQEKELELKRIENQAGQSLDNFNDPLSVYAPLTLKDIQTMDEGLIAFGPHTASHSILTRLTSLEAEIEIINSKNIVKKSVKNFSNVMSYPNGQSGDWDDKIENTVKREQFLGALTTIPGLVNYNDNLFTLKRLTMDGTDNWNLFLATISGFRALIQSIKSKRD